MWYRRVCGWYVDRAVKPAACSASLMHGLVARLREAAGLILRGSIPIRIYTRTTYPQSPHCWCRSAYWCWGRSTAPATRPPWLLWLPAAPADTLRWRPSSPRACCRRAALRDDGPSARPEVSEGSVKRAGERQFTQKPEIDRVGTLLGRWGGEEPQSSPLLVGCSLVGPPSLGPAVVGMMRIADETTTLGCKG